MSKESAMAAYVHEMKKVAQEVLLKLLWPTLEDPMVGTSPGGCVADQTGAVLCCQHPAGQ